MKKLKSQYEEIYKSNQNRFRSIGIMIFCFISFIYANTFTFWVLVSVPIVGIFLNGLINKTLASIVIFNHQGKGINITDFIIYPTSAIALSLLLRYNVEKWEGLLFAAGLIFLLMISLLFFFHTIPNETIKVVLEATSSTLFFLAIFSYFVAYGINIYMDNSYAQLYKAEIIKKEISTGKGKSSGRKTYYVVVGPWGEIDKVNKIPVSKSKFEFIEVGDSLEIIRNEGRLNVPWFKSL